MCFAATSTSARRLVSALLILPLALLVCGCGSGSPASKKTGKGTAVFTIKWPAVQKSTKLVPAAANIIRVQLMQNQNGAFQNYRSPQDAARPYPAPAAGTANLPPSVTTLTFSNLPPGAFTATATAYPSYKNGNTTPADPTQSVDTVAAQANATVPFTVADGQTTTSNLTMGTTITELALTMGTSSVGITPTTPVATMADAPFTFTVQARDASHNNVVTNAIQVSVPPTQSAIATVTDNHDGTFTINNAGKLGTVTVTATEADSHVSQNFTFTFQGLYVADGNDRVTRLDGISGNNRLNFRPPSSTDPQAFCVALDSNAEIYFAYNNTVNSDNGISDHNTILALITSIDGGIAASYTDAHSFSGYRGLTIDRQNRLYVADYNNGRVFRINNDLDSASIITYNASANDPARPLLRPAGIALDTAGRLYIADSGNNRIVRVNSTSGTDFSNGAGFITFPPAPNDHTLNNPQGVAVDTDGRIYIADTGNNRIVRINDMSGNGILPYSGPVANTMLGIPTAIVLDGQNRIYVGDTGNERIIRVDDISGKNPMQTPRAGSNAMFPIANGLAIH